MYLSYSGWAKARHDAESLSHSGCLYAYWNGYINKTVLATPEDRLGSIFGSVVGKLFEDFYNERLWKQNQPQGLLTSRVEATIQKILTEETTTTSEWRRAGTLKWKGTGPDQNPKGLYATPEELAADVRDTLERGFRTIRAERLLGKDARAEVKLNVSFQGHTLGGRADFIMTRIKPHSDLIILDGKGSKYRDRYADPKQLLWYAMLYRIKKGRIPDRLGFLYWRFDPPDSLDWIVPTASDIDELQEQVLASISEIETLTKALPPDAGFEEARSVFLPIAERKGVKRSVVKEACRFCPYAVEAICPAGAKAQPKK